MSARRSTSWPIPVRRPRRGVSPRAPRSTSAGAEQARVGQCREREPEAVIDEAFREAEALDPEHRCWVVLLDGNKDQLALTKLASKKLKAGATIVVDLMHVLEYLWRAAHVLLRARLGGGGGRVQQRLMWLLQGRSSGTIATAMRQSARAAKLSDSEMAAVNDTADYLQDYARYMRYGEASPRASDCDRRHRGCLSLPRQGPHDRGGARWTLNGAEAVLRLRALRASGDFDAYWASPHVAEESRTIPNATQMDIYPTRCDPAAGQMTEKTCVPRGADPSTS